MTRPDEKIAIGTCWKCGAPLFAADFGRGDTCPSCRNDTKVCKNCEFFEPSVHNQCRETSADRQVEKERSNFCDYFKPSLKAGATGMVDPIRAAKEAAEALFKKKS